MASSRNLVSTIRAQASPKKGRNQVSVRVSVTLYNYFHEIYPPSNVSLNEKFISYERFKSVSLHLDQAPF